MGREEPSTVELREHNFTTLEPAVTKDNTLLAPKETCAAQLRLCVLGGDESKATLFRPAVLQVPGLRDIVVPAFGLEGPGRWRRGGCRLDIGGCARL
jgi:hypothetical protein